jgi:hypothetical protein
VTQPRATIIQADAARLPLADQCVDLVFGSPPYCDARTYGIGAQRGCAEWIAWMLDVTTECLRVCRGPVVWVAAGVTRDRTYWPACEGLMYEWWKRGGSLYRPCYWHRIGIMGSGGDNWFRADVEYVMCFKRPGALPWSDNTARGHAPRWAAGGEMSYRLSNGQRVNQWGPVGAGRGRRPNGAPKAGSSPSHVESRWGRGGAMPETRKGDVARVPKRVNLNQRNGDGERSVGSDEIQAYRPPAIANPGNLIHTKAGGGHYGDRLCHQNEAPFPERLVDFFIASLCPPGGTVLDPFSGSGTTAKVALSLGRNAIASDIRESQCELTRRRIASVQGLLL